MTDHYQAYDKPPPSRHQAYDKPPPLRDRAATAQSSLGERQTEHVTKCRDVEFQVRLGVGNKDHRRGSLWHAGSEKG